MRGQGHWAKALFCLSIAGAFAAGHEETYIEAPHDETTPIRVELSHNSHNRIVWKEGYIKNVTADSRFFSVQINPHIGQAFVTLTQPILDKEASITLISDAGIVQDLIVTSCDKPVTTVAIYEIGGEKESLEKLSFHGNTVYFLNELLAGRSPIGYGQAALEATDALNLPKLLDATAIAAYEGPFERVVVYEVKNKGSKPIILTPSSIERTGDLWVFLGRHELARKEKTRLLIAKPKGEVSP